MSSGSATTRSRPSDELTRRAKDNGQLRAGFVPGDLTLLLMANSGIVAESTEDALAASQRLVAYMLDAFVAGPAGQLPPPVPLDLRHIFDTRA